MASLATAVSAIAVIQVLGKVFEVCQKYYFAAKDARKDIRRLSNELTELSDILEKIEELAKSPDPERLPILTRLSNPEGVLKQCMVDLEELAAKLVKGHTKDKMKRFGLGALEWPINAKDVDKIVLAIGRHKETLSLALTVDQM